jgi:hypothetical protein
MSVVYPQFWNKKKCQPTLKHDFVEKLNTLVHHFCKKVEIHGEQVKGILDQSKLFQQATHFDEIMWNNFFTLENPLEYSTITRLWIILGASQYLQENISKYFKLADLCQTLILGSYEDERMLSALLFLKSNMRNKLEKHMDISLILYVIEYDITNFSYERALSLWRSDCDRRGGKNITNFSNELDTKQILWNLIMIVHLEMVLFRMKKMSTKVRTEKLIYRKILSIPIFMRA